MANGWGGARPGSGRKPGGKNRSARVLAARARWKALGIDAKADVIARSRAWLEVHEDSVLEELLQKGDHRTLLEVWRTMRGYAFGPPRQRVEIMAGPSPLELLEEIAEERRRNAIDVKSLPS